MGASIRVVSQKFYSKLNNGNDFTTNETTDFSQHLKGGVLEEVKAVFNVQIDWNTKIGASTSSYYYDTANTTDTFIFRVDGKDFIQEGFAVGDLVRISDPQWSILGNIKSMSIGEILIDNITLTGTLTGDVWSFPSADIWVTGLTEKTALKYDFGLIENDEPINFLSKLTNTEQTYLFKGIGLRSDPTDPTTRSTDFVDGESAGNNKATYTGSASIKFVGLSVGVDPIITPTPYTTQEFQIEHIFKINPIYRDGELDSLKGVDVPPLDIYNGNLSLKYVFQTEFRTVINNPNTSMVSSYDTQLGSVGYLGESYNGYKNNYTVSDLVYTVNSLPVDRLEIGSITNVSFKINNDQGTFANTTPVVVGHTSIVNSLYYSNSTDDYQTVWTDEDLRLTSGVISTQFNGTLIKNATSTYVSTSELSISFDVEFTAEQELKLEDKQDYLLYFTIQDPDETIDTGDKVTDRIEVNYYFKNTDVAGLFDFDELQQYPHPLEYEEGVSEGFTNAKTFNESGMMADGRFWVLNTATLNSLKFDVAVYDLNSDTWNSLRSLNIDLSDQILVNGIQQIELDTTRGYILKDGDIFNYLKITTDTLVGTKQYYNIQVGYRMPWQSWLEFKDAPTDFYDKSKSFNGLNQKSSNYSLDNANYGIKVLFDAVVDSTNYVKTSEEIKVYDYDEDDQNPTAWTCEIKTFDINETEIANNVIKDGYTQVRAFFKPLVTPTFTSSVNLQEASDNWVRFAHGNKITSNSSAFRKGTWANTQANDKDDEFQAPSGPFVSKDTVSYTSTAPPSSTITTIDNVFAVYGLYSDDKYEFYEIEGKMFSNDADDDNITYVIAFMTDDEGVEHTLSLCATTGGIGHELSPNYIKNNTSTSSIFRQGETPISPTDTCKWDLVYDFGKSSCVNLGGKDTGEEGFNWNDSKVNDLNFNVKRSGDLIEIVVSWEIDGETYGAGETIEYDLNTITEITFDNGDFAQGSFQALTTKFKGVHNIGFAFCSQAGGGFKNVSLTKPEDDFYSILRIEPKESQSDFSNYELSSIIDVPENNLINKVSEDSNVLEYDFINDVFVATGLIDTTKIEKGQQYDLSAEIRPRNLEE